MKTPYLIKLNIRSGEREFSSYTVKDIEGGEKEAEKTAELHAQNFYDENAPKDGEGYSHLGGEIIVEVVRITALFPQEAATLRKHLGI